MRARGWRERRAAPLDPATREASTTFVAPRFYG